ncbi:MAG: DinB family protein [Anaerolineales bacterium]|nr:DinB family protein [Anaerolineales bacterium]
MSKSLLTIEQILDLLTKHPIQIAEYTADLKSDQLHTSPEQGEWSINDILAHLRSCSDVWGNAMETIIAHDQPTIKAISPRTWIKQADYPEQPFRTSLQAFTKQRTKLLAALNALPHKSWSRSATVTGAGKPLNSTVFSYARRLVLHERSHVNQIKHIADA